MNWKYLIIPVDSHPFFTDLFEYENYYQKGMIVFNMNTFELTKDGIQWEIIEGAIWRNLKTTK